MGTTYHSQKYDYSCLAFFPQKKIKRVSEPVPWNDLPEYLDIFGVRSFGCHAYFSFEKIPLNSSP